MKFKAGGGIKPPPEILMLTSNREIKEFRDYPQLITAYAEIKKASAAAVFGREIAEKVLAVASSQNLSVPQALLQIEEVTAEDAEALFNFDRFSNPQELTRFISTFKNRQGRA